LSRSRYWGIPLPIWRSEDGLHEKCIGSINELRAEIEKANRTLGIDQKVPEDLHRPYIDDVILVSDVDGKRMQRESDLIDVWFDSGAMPYAQWGYCPDADGNKQALPFGVDQKSKLFPADFIAEGVDQTRGWFTLYML
jgi:isoleucyl-tRNA synthetase